VSGLPDHAVAQDPWSIGAASYVTKPFDCDGLVSTVRRVLSRPRRLPIRGSESPGAGSKAATAKRVQTRRRALDPSIP
jgi:DNA-binding response OmpR family regulator